MTTVRLRPHASRSHEADIGFAVHQDLLEFLVPLRMTELAHLDKDELLAHRTMSCGIDHGGYSCANVSEIIGSHADSWMYAPRTPEGRAARRALVTGLAVAALVAEGGITFCGMHFCADHDVCRKAEAAAAATNSNPCNEDGPGADTPEPQMGRPRIERKVTTR